MTTTTASQHHLRRVFIENFSAADIAEPLASFDASTSEIIPRFYRGVPHFESWSAC